MDGTTCPSLNWYNTLNARVPSEDEKSSGERGAWSY